MNKISGTILQIRENNPCEVFFYNGRAFVSIEPVKMAEPCACGGKYWNASNLSNNIHFHDKEILEIEFPIQAVYVRIETDEERAERLVSGLPVHQSAFISMMKRGPIGT